MDSSHTIKLKDVIVIHDSEDDFEDCEESDQSDPEESVSDEDVIERSESDTDEMVSDDSEDDPNFEIDKESFSPPSESSSDGESNFQHRVKRIRQERESDDDKKEEEDQGHTRTYEELQNLIQVGQLEKLRVDEFKQYLRKHSLRLAGNRETLMERIREHIGIAKGRSREKYPESSFIINCKGDACTGDVVMFRQNVYETYNKASRGGGGEVIGRRTVVGRIVKDSYGAAKQQHTFTIEVIWSKGKNPHPPLHPLLIKGRNLYKLHTLRQKWHCEAKRKQILFEKHSRGSLARSKRDERIRNREARDKLNPRRKASRRKTVPPLEQGTSRKQERQTQGACPPRPPHYQSRVGGVQNGRHEEQEVLHRQPLMNKNHYHANGMPPMNNWMPRPMNWMPRVGGYEEVLAHQQSLLFKNHYHANQMPPMNWMPRPSHRHGRFQ